MKKIFKILLSAFVAGMPVSAFAIDKISDLNDVVHKAVNIGNLLIYLLMFLSVIFIVWNVVIYMIKPSDDDRKAAGKSVAYGILGLFIILSIWGLVNILMGTFVTNNTAPVERFPNVNFVK